MTDHEHVWVEAVVVQAPGDHEETLGVHYHLCAICGQGRGVDQRPGAKYNQMHAQAEGLEAAADWVDQPDAPTGAQGLVTSMELRMRAIALRVQADVLSEETQ